MNYRQALEYLDAHINLEATAGRIEGLSLEPIAHLTAGLGDPQSAYPTIHITGTNGKGSVAHMVSAVLQEQGLRVGTYTSPHLEWVNERIALNGEPLTDEQFAEAVGEVAMVADLVDMTPSYFEILTAAALALFAGEAVEVAVVEVGLLGEYDATNVVDAAVAVVTNVGKDHTDGDGDWRVAIAEEKAGIIKPGSTAVIGETSLDVIDVFRAREAEACWVRDIDFAVTARSEAVGGQLLCLRCPHGTYDDVFLPLLGAHQADNASTAVTAVEAFFGRALPDDVVTEALGSVVLPGRFELVDHHPAVVLDGAHNPQGMAALGRTLSEVELGGRRAFVIGLLGGRDPVEMLAALGPVSDDVVLVCTPESARAMDPASVVEAAKSLALDAESAGSPIDALQAASALVGDEGLVVVAGSLYVVGAVRAHLAAADSQ